MPMFVHLAPESRVALIRRNGIGRLRKRRDEQPGGIFAMPVTRRDETRFLRGRQQEE